MKKNYLMLSAKFFVIVDAKQVLSIYFSSALQQIILYDI